MTQLETGPITIGTRGSPLAMIQAHMVQAALMEIHGLSEAQVPIRTVKTTGDRVQDRPLAEIGGKALWTKELDRALAEGEIDCAVHSMKDVETLRPDAIRLAATLPRADCRDRLIGADSIAALAEGATIGTSSPRRAAQLLSLRKDLRIANLRGNVATRLAAVESGTVDATLLAAAGLDRLGHTDIGAVIPIDTLLPAAQQGAIGIEVRADDAQTGAAIAAISDVDTFAAIAAERALLAAIGGDCHSPVAALARIDNGVMTISAEILRDDGSETVSGRQEGPVNQGIALAESLGAELLEDASPALRALFAR